MMVVNNGTKSHVVENERDSHAMMNGFLKVADVESVYSDPVEKDGVTIIQAAEIIASGGFGFGEGSAIGPAETEGLEDSTTSNEMPTGEGRGGGGGGFFTGRPVAAIIIENNQVRVEPIVDVTKVALAFFTMLGSLAFMLINMRSIARAEAKKVLS